MSGLKKTIEKIFGIGKIEFSGFKLLVFTVLVCWLGLAITNYYSKLPYNNYEKDVRILDSLLLLMDKRGALKHSSYHTMLENFDPNAVSKEKLIFLGFPEWLAARIIKYRSTGARFNQPKDLLKIYGFPDSLFLVVEEYITIKKQPPKINVRSDLGSPNTVKVRHKFEKKTEVLPIFDLNKADTAVLKTIKGVGSKLSARIVAYRTSLGGFISASQLYQIYRLDTMVVKRIISNSTIASDFMPKKINVNNATKADLAAHPHINWTQAKLIIAYRNQHGAYERLEELLKVYSIDAYWLKINAPYLTF